MKCSGTLSKSQQEKNNYKALSKSDFSCNGYSSYVSYRSPIKQYTSEYPLFNFNSEIKKTSLVRQNPPNFVIDSSNVEPPYQYVSNKLNQQNKLNSGIFESFFYKWREGTTDFIDKNNYTQSLKFDNHSKYIPYKSLHRPIEQTNYKSNDIQSFTNRHLKRDYYKDYLVESDKNNEMDKSFQITTKNKTYQKRIIPLYDPTVNKNNNRTRKVIEDNRLDHFDNNKNTIENVRLKLPDGLESVSDQSNREFEFENIPNQFIRGAESKQTHSRKVKVDMYPNKISIQTISEPYSL